MSTKESNPTKYRMYFNYNNDKDVYVIPMLPEKIKAQAKGKTISIDIDKFGEYVEKGKRDAMIISFSSYFPAVYGRSYCSCLKKEFKSPEKWHKWMLALEGKSFRFISYWRARHLQLICTPLLLLIVLRKQEETLEQFRIL